MYKLREDICIAEVDNIYLFVALRSAWDECPFAVLAPPVLVFIFKALQRCCSKEDIINQLINQRGYSFEKADRIFNNFIQKAEKLHYLIEESDPC